MEKITPLKKMTNAQLRELVVYMESRVSSDEYKAADVSKWTRDSLVNYIECLKTPEPLPPPKSPKSKKRKRISRNVGVGKWCMALACRVIGTTPDGFPEGMSYIEMTAAAQKKFPESAVDEHHMRWYAAKARVLGMNVPAHRQRSSWK